MPHITTSWHSYKSVHTVSWINANDHRPKNAKIAIRIDKMLTKRSKLQWYILFGRGLFLNICVQVAHIDLDLHLKFKLMEQSWLHMWLFHSMLYTYTLFCQTNSPHIRAWKCNTWRMGKARHVSMHRPTKTKQLMNKHVDMCSIIALPIMTHKAKAFKIILESSYCVCSAVQCCWNSIVQIKIHWGPLIYYCQWEILSVSHFELSIIVLYVNQYSCSNSRTF